MHVRWQHRAADLRNKDQAHWAATLVENVRIGDKMTERYVAYLAGIGERDMPDRHALRQASGELPCFRSARFHSAMAAR